METKSTLPRTNTGSNTRPQLSVANSGNWGSSEKKTPSESRGETRGIQTRWGEERIDERGTGCAAIYNSGFAFEAVVYRERPGRAGHGEPGRGDLETEPDATEGERSVRPEINLPRFHPFRVGYDPGFRCTLVAWHVFSARTVSHRGTSSC